VTVLRTRRGRRGRRDPSRRRRSQDGTSSVEYALILVGIALGSIVLIVAFVRVAKSSYDHTCQQVGTGGASTAPAACG
jgi:Flp pilus assembly pilin Flp